MLPLILSGPILRRTTASDICIWLATSQVVQAVTATIYLADDSALSIATQTQATIAFGKKLHVVLLQVSPPTGKTFPEDTLLCYDISLDGQLLSELEIGKAIAYPPLTLPSFFIQSAKTPLNLLFGSCRKIHGSGLDCLAIGDTTIAQSLQNIQERPSALFLGGDQIYADDVSSVIMPTIKRLSDELIGSEEKLAGTQDEAGYKFGSRGYLLKGLGLEKLDYYADNHVIKFGEYAALYCLSWNPDLWLDAIFEEAEQNLDQVDQFVCQGEKAEDKVVSARLKRHEKEISLVKNYALALKAVRRLLANVPTYMIFDDHEVTDDWNLTHDWKSKMASHTLGAQLLSNGLAAYWLFQAWGNNPAAFHTDFITGMTAFIQARTSPRPYTLQQYLHFYGLHGLGFPRWAFICPTYPRTLFLDTRTKRYYEFYDNTLEKRISLEKIKSAIAQGTNKVINFILKFSNAILPGKEEEFSKKLAPRLINRNQFQFLKEQFAQELGQEVFFLVSAAPVFGLQRIEDSFRFTKDIASIYQFDNESWAANYLGYLKLLDFLSNDLQARHCIILSGDVHYGFANQCEVELDSAPAGAPPMKFTQITSSSLKNNVKHLLGDKRSKLLALLEENMEPGKKYQDIEWVEKRSYFGFNSSMDEAERLKIINDNNLGSLRYDQGSLLYKFLVLEDYARPAIELKHPPLNIEI